MKTVFRRGAWALLGVLVGLAACVSSPPQPEPEDPHAPWDPAAYPPHNKFVIYQLLVRTFSNPGGENVPNGTRQQNGVGTFNGITTQALERIKDLGVTHVWYTGVIRHATMDDFTAYGIPQDDSDVVKGRAGSPYAITDYYDVSPALAVNVRQRMQEFEALVKRTQDLGLKVLIDFVPNHVARGYRSVARPAGVRDLGQDDDTTKAFAPNNNFYYILGESFQVPVRYNPLGPDIVAPLEDGRFEETPAKVTGNDVNRARPSVNDWFETVKLNYGVDMFSGGARTTHFDPPPSTWLKMRDILLYWVGKGVDGFRVDMAEMVPAEFWAWVIPQIEARRPGVLFVAEIYNPSAYERYHRAGFDVLYDKVGLYDKVKPVVRQVSLPSRITDWWTDLPVSPHIMLKFLENHDEVRVASRLFAGNPWAGLPGMAVTTLISPGPVMLYAGQEVGEPALGAEGFGGDDGRTSIFDYWAMPEFVKWVNQGRFDGGGLSEDQLRLRAAYRSLLRLAQDHEALRGGALYDLDWYNRGRAGYPRWAYSFLRFSPNQRILVVALFDKEPSRATVSFPRGAWERLGLSPDTRLRAVDLLTDESFALEGGRIVVDLPAYGYRVLELR